MTIGEIYEITHKEGCTVQGRLLEVREDEDYEWFRFDILDNGGIDEHGNPDPNERYIVEYSQRKRPDYSGVEKNTNIPQAYAGKTLDDFKWGFYADGAPEVRREVEKFLRNFRAYQDNGMGLFLTSRTKGSGKTLLACCLANEIVRKFAMNTKFINIASYLQKCREKDSTFMDFRNATILVLDDFGVQDDEKGFDKDKTYDLIDHRSSQNLTTIFTSNLTKDHCSKFEATASRVYQMAVEIQMPEISVRKVLADMKIKAFKESLK